MADRLTQVQDCIEELLALIYASINYCNTRAPYGSVPGQPSQAPHPQPAATQALVNGDASKPQPNGPSQAPPAPAQDAEGPPPSPAKESPENFTAGLREISRAIVLKQQQLELLINSLPGLGNSQADQERRMSELEVELREVEAERAKAEEDKERMIDALGEVLAKTRRVP